MTRHLAILCLALAGCSSPAQLPHLTATAGACACAAPLSPPLLQAAGDAESVDGQGSEDDDLYSAKVWDFDRMHESTVDPVVEISLDLADASDAVDVLFDLGRVARVADFADTVDAQAQLAAGAHVG